MPDYETHEIPGGRVIAWPVRAPTQTHDQFRTAERAEGRERRKFAGLLRVVADALEADDPAKAYAALDAARHVHAEWRAGRHELDEERARRALHFEGPDDGPGAA